MKPISDNNSNLDEEVVDTIELILSLDRWLKYQSNKRITRTSRQEVIQNILNTPSYKEINGSIEIIVRTRTGAYIEKTIPDIYYKSRYPSNGNITQYGFSFRLYNKNMHITLTHPTVFGRTEEIIIKELKPVLHKHFNIKKEYLDIIDTFILLSRIDFKRDYRYRNLEEFYLMLQIFKIAPNYIICNNYKKTGPKKNSKDLSFLKYISKSNKYVEFSVYDKEKEMVRKFNDSKATKEQCEKFRNIIRFEVRIKNDKLNSLKKSKGLKKLISNYKNPKSANQFFTQYVKGAFFTEAFYILDVAKKIVARSSEKEKTKEKLIKLLETINKHGYTYAKDNYPSTMFSKHISKLRKLNINPLTFKETWNDGNKTTYEKLCNFTLAEHCIKEWNVLD